MDNVAEQILNKSILFEVDVLRPHGNQFGDPVRAWKVISRWITYATSCEEAEANFLKMVADDKGEDNLIDSWHPREDDSLSSVPVEFMLPDFVI